MPSEFLDPAETERRQRLEFDFPARSLEGRVILVPGGSGGLGAATVAQLAAEGAQVVVGYQKNAERAAELAETLNKHGSSQGRVHCVQADLSSRRTGSACWRPLRASQGRFTAWSASWATRPGSSWKTSTMPP